MRELLKQIRDLKMILSAQRLVSEIEHTRGVKLLDGACAKLSAEEVDQANRYLESIYKDYGLDVNGSFPKPEADQHIFKVKERLATKPVLPEQEARFRDGTHADVAN